MSSPTSKTRVFLIRINDRPYGFRVVAAVALNEECAIEDCRIRWFAQNDDVSKGDYAEVIDSCETTIGSMAELEFEE